MLKFEGVKKHYEDFELDLTLEVPEGYVTGLIGANGAGKSTAFKAALGLIRPDAGVVKMLGKNVEDFTVQDKEWEFSAELYHAAGRRKDHRTDRQKRCRKEYRV